MTSLEQLVESLIEEVLKETAITAKQMRSKGLALYIERSGSDFNSVLYNPVIFENDFKEFMKDELYLLSDTEVDIDNLKEIPFDILEIAAQYAISTIELQPAEIVLGTLSGKWDDSCEAFEITGVAAQHGYGPFLYDVAASIFGWVISDRRTVSPDAQNIWSWMFKHPEVYSTRKLLQQCKSTFLSKQEMGQPFLQFAFRPKITKKAKTKALVSNHQRFLKTLLSMGVSENSISDMFLDMSNKFFQEMV